MWIMDKIKQFFGSIELPQQYDRKRFLEDQILQWKFSPQRREMIEGEKYYDGFHDILRRKRTVIGKAGELEEVNNLPNNRIVDNQFAKMVDQKANYLLSKPITFETGNDTYDNALAQIFNRSFLTKLKNGGVDALCGGLFWFYVYYDQNGKLGFQRFKAHEILPFWKDADHTELDCAVRLYPVEVWSGGIRDIVEKVEIFTAEGIERYVFDNNRLVEDVENPHGYYAYVGDQGFTWEKIPLVAFKYNAREIPLIRRVKGLQDALNMMQSDLLNNMQEDSRNTILVIKNYDGQDLGEFRRNLATYGAVKVRTIDGGDSGVETLNVEVNSQNYDLVLKTIKKAIIENAMGYDAKDDRLGSNANMMNLRSMYSDVDLDADNMEAEFQASFEQLLFFVNSYLKTAAVSVGDEQVKITFNRDMMVNETEVIDNLVKLGVQLPNELLVGQVPFVDNVKDVMDMLKKEREETEDTYGSAFPLKEEVQNEE